MSKRTVSKRRVSKSHGFVYLFVSHSTGWYKIGKTDKTAEDRLDHIQQEAPGMDITLVGYIQTDDPGRLERAFHNTFHYTKPKPEEWSKVAADYNVVGQVARSEWFKLNPLQVELFRAIAQTVGVSGATLLMAKHIKRLEGILKASQREARSYDDRYFDLLEKLEDWKYDRRVARDQRITIEKNAQLQEENDQLKAENRRLREELAAAGHETEDEP